MKWRRGKNKYGAVSTGSFPSKLEAAVYQILLLRERSGEVKEIRRQHVVSLTEAKINYKVDFSCTLTSTGETLFVEAKGYATDVWNLKKRLWEYYGPGKLEIWCGDYRRPFLKETVIPEN